jgi:hypothetical protein
VFEFEQVLIGRARLQVGFNAEFALQEGGASMVDAQCARPVTMQGVQAHQAAIGRFMQRVVAQQALGVIDGDYIVALRLRQQDEPFQRLDKRLLPSFPFGQYPLIIATKQ